MSKRQFQQLRVKFVGKKICWIVDEILLQLLMNIFFENWYRWTFILSALFKLSD